jgi:hypothetical protein
MAFSSGVATSSRPAMIKVGGSTAAEIARKRRLHEHLGHARDRGRLALAKFLCEPAFHVRADKGGEALFRHELDAVVPGVFDRVVAIGVRQHQPLDAFGGIGANPLANHAAHR